MRVFLVKSRPSNDPLIVHVNSIVELAQLTTHIPPILESLARRFWPGPLTVVLPRGWTVPLEVTSHTDTVAIRMPSHPVARALIAASERPIAAPSANLFAHTSPTTAAHVARDLGDRIDLILDAGQTSVGVESTVLDLTRVPPRLLRPGGVTLEALTALIGIVDLEIAPDDNVRSPGTAKRHYAPNTPLMVIDDADAEAARQVFLAVIHEARLRGHSVGVLTFDEDIALVSGEGASVERLGALDDDHQHAHSLYAATRALDDQNVDVIIVRMPNAFGIDLALRDRLRRAANGRVVSALEGRAVGELLDSFALAATPGSV